MLKKDNQANDDEIYERVKNSGTTYYEYYAIVVSNEEKYYVATKDDAESIINELKSKKSTNINKIAYTQVHSTEMKEFTEKDKVVTALYVKPVVVASAYATYSGTKNSKYRNSIISSFRYRINKASIWNNNIKIWAKI